MMSKWGQTSIQICQMYQKHIHIRKGNLCWKLYALDILKLQIYKLTK